MTQNEPDWPTVPPDGPRPRRGGGRERWSLRKKLLVWGCSALAVVIVAVAIGVGVAWRHLNGNIKTEDAQLKPSAMGGKQDILFIGSDSRAGGNQALGGGDVSGARSDTTMVFDSPPDRSKGTEVSIPRDSMVQIPDCTATGGATSGGAASGSSAASGGAAAGSATAGSGTVGSTVTGGGTIAANFGMFNSAFSEGGAPCTVKTVESLTGLTLTHYLAIDFEGVVGVVNALGGVRVCVTQAIDDADSGLRIPAGTTTLDGDQALAFVRLRHSVGDGSDLERIQRQQYFLDQLESQVRAAGLITDPIKLYKVLDAATQSITTDPGLGTVTDLYNLAQTLNQIPNGKMTYVTVPNGPYPADPDRVIWTEPDATNLWNSLIAEASSAGASASASSSRSSSQSASASSSLSVSASSAALGQLESLLELELMAAGTSTDGTSTSSGTGPSASSASGSASSSATGTSSPGGADVGTCPVS